MELVKFLENNNTGKNYEINFSYSGDIEKLKEDLKTYLEPYNSLTITNGTLAKKEATKLRKLVKEIEDYRKKLKDKILENFLPLEEELKELAKMIEPAIKTIQDQVNELDNQEKENKRKEIYQIIADLQIDHSFFEEIPFNEKWLNKTTKLSHVKQDVELYIFQTKEAQKETSMTCDRTLKFKNLTKEKMEKMLKFFKDNNIEFEKIS